MWNHAQNCSPSGEENTNEVDSSPNIKEKIEKSLDLTHYLKYLHHLFSQENNSESEYSDSDEDGKTRSFNDFLQPTAQASDRPQPQYSQNHIALGISNSSDTNHVASYTTAKLENFQLEANISSSSLSSIDSGTSSLSLTLSSDNCTEQFIKVERDNNGSSKSSVDKNASVIEDEKSSENSSENDKKSQKKKKTSKSSNESFTRHHKPSSGGKGNGSSGGGAGGLSTNGSSGESSGSSGGSSSSSQGFGGSSGSPAATSRCGIQAQNLQLLPRKQTQIVLKHNDESTFLNINSNEELLKSAESQNSRNSIDEESDALLLDGEFADQYSDELLSNDAGHGDSFETSGLNSFPLTAILDIREDEGCMSDYISMTAPHHLPSLINTSTMSQSSTNFFTDIAAAAESSFVNCSQNSKSLVDKIHCSVKESSKADGLKRKLDLVQGKRTPDKLSKLTDKQKQTRIEMLNAKRRKVYVYICRKEIGKTQRSRASTFKESLLMKRKLAQACSRHLRRKAMQSQKCMKESVCKAKRLTQEMEMYWKMVEREERDLQRQKEKEAQDKMRRDMEILNEKLQERNINFLVTLLELFSLKLLKISENNESELDILRKLDEIKDNRTAHLDKYDSKAIKVNAQLTVDLALKEHRSLVELMDMSGLFAKNASTEVDVSHLISQSQMFEGVLKNYQSVGLRWLKKLYILGLNGILADEMGLGKKTQVIAFLTNLAETARLWGPFLIVAPTTSLLKWKQDFDRLSPRFKVISYWGKPMERKILRQFWEKSSFRAEDASFHVVITSHQVMVSDLKYFSKIKWQYMIMDDSQGSITSSTKWMPLLSFRCRNKLLLSNNLRLNSQSHLCSYLYFIMPSLFDAKVEMTEWLLKELESPTRDHSLEANQDVSSRLRTVIQKFLLRRMKENVEAEVTQTVDILVYCTLSRRQLQIYNDLLETTDLHNVLRELEDCKPEAEIRSRMKEVLHLSLQLRKTCNHPDLIEKRHDSTSFWMGCGDLSMPKLIYQDSLFLSPSSRMNYVGRKLSIYQSVNVHRSIFYDTLERGYSSWGFSRILNLSCSEVEELYGTESSSRLIHLVNFQSVLENIYFESVWRSKTEKRNLLDYPNSMLCHALNQSEVLSKLVFTSSSSSVYALGNCRILSVPESSIEHRSLRSRTLLSNVEKAPTPPENIDYLRNELTCSLQPLEYPKFIRCCSAKVTSEGFQPLVSSRVVNIQVKYRENRLSLTEIINSGNFQGKSSKPNFWTNMIYKKWSSTPTSADYMTLVSDSGKLRKLDELLAILRRNGKRILICAYIEETLSLLEDFLTFRKWKYDRLGRGMENPSRSDVFVYLFPGQSCVSYSSRISVDTVIFFDQDWNAKIEEQKNKIVKNLVQCNKVNWYRLISEGTLEERILRLSTERNIVSLALCKEVLENTNVSSVPSLRSLVTILMSEYANKKSLREPVLRPSISKEMLQNEHVQKHTNKSFNVAPKTAYTKDIHSGAYGRRLMNQMNGWHYLNGGEGSDSASPSNSEELDSGELEGDMDIKGYHDEDNFNFNMDEGYIGMSPDSFEDITAKSDYEEESSPKKAKMVRGTGKRGRPPSRIRIQIRDFGDSQARRGPGRPRLKPVGPANQGVRGRRPGRPPLSKKAETISSGLTPLSSSQRVFGFYSSPDLELS
ncbi:unnamed protein product [Orchesella dallaii]|uniref:Chromatin-remodeling ATPase INO80 n=1 Tax=Orchesella dallaii TaxID=48710 RepID=A0ABP1QPL2_9HEXA